MATAAIFNLAGLALAGWGVAMLLGVYPLLPHLLVTAITFTGLGMIAISTVRLTILMLSSVVRRNPAREVPGPAEAVTAHPLPNRARLARAMSSLQEEALDLIERRREIHHLNVHQWHYAHREETAAEIEANKRYRQAKNVLDLERLSIPTQFWMPLDNFCGVVEQSLAREVYSPPTDQGVYQIIDQHRQLTLQQFEAIAASAPGPGQSLTGRANYPLQRPVAPTPGAGS